MRHDSNVAVGSETDSRAITNLKLEFRFLPTKKNRRSWKLDKQIRRNLERLIGRRKSAVEEEERKPDGSPGSVAKDLLGLMISAGSGPRRANFPSASISVRDIVEECKTFFFAGKQTTSNLLTWTTVLLAMHEEWQERARLEVLQVCGSRDIPSRHQLTKLKTVRPHSKIRNSISLLTSILPTLLNTAAAAGHDP